MINDLRELHSKVPLTAHDYAAIRARVRAEIARSNQRPTFFALVARFAFALLVLFVLYVPSVLEQPAPKPKTAPVQTAHAPAPLPLPLPPAPPPARAITPKPNPPQLARTEPLRIELQTPDPDVRIIWIVNAEPPKENS